MYDGKVIDCDVHHDWGRPSDLVGYMSKGWQEYVQGPGRLMNDDSMIPVHQTQLIPNPTGTNRPDSFPGDGRAAASDYELLRTQLLEPARIERAILQYGPAGFVGALPNPYYATEVARAANDWSIDNWLELDDERLYGAVLVASQLPNEAAKEIRRVGGHPRMAEVLLASSGMGKPFGHPTYYPIYEAAVEMNLPVAIHTGGEAFPGQGASPIGSGMPSFYYEVAMLTFQGSMTHMTSLISHGVFEKFPDLRVLIVECGLGWIPGFLWRLDGGYKALRRELPWLKKRPSEYFAEHIRVSTQPLDRPDDPEELVRVLELFDGENILCFASDYPHWDADEVEYVTKWLPERWQPKIFRENARRLYGWDDLPEAGLVASAQATG
jgi:predicted TIM-barrel fold metal-dependent hydrolase